MINSKYIIGKFYATLDAYMGTNWIDRVSMYFPDSDPIETYEWLGQVPQLREWVGARDAKEFVENEFSITNVKYESSVDMPVSWLVNDKTGQVDLRISELAVRAASQWASLISTLILEGENDVCYDTFEFFDTIHEEGDSGAQSNLLTAGDVPALEVESSTKPTVAEAINAILGVIAHIQSVVDDRAEPMNSEAKGFVVLCAPALWAYLVHATTGEIAQGGASNVIKELAKQGYTVEVLPNPRLSAWTASFAVIRTDGLAKAFIRQEEEKVSVGMKDENSEYAFDTDRVQAGVKAVRAAGYGLWQYAAKATMSDA